MADPIVECRRGDLASWIRRQADGADRYVFGIAGPPGSGKSTLAARLGDELGAPVVPMDGFHLPNAVLRTRGLLDVKGAPETFDSPAFVELVRALRDTNRVVSCPVFDRVIDEPVVDGLHVRPGDGVVVVEGNYLLLDRPPWNVLVDLFDAIAYLDVPVGVRRRRLVARHVEFGRDPADAAEFVQRSDEANARVVEASRSRARLLVRS